MITINSYLHRDVLCDIIRRWMYGDVHASDADLITRLVHFNNVYVSRYLQYFSENIFRTLHSGELHSKPTFIKHDLKDIIVVNPAYRNERIDELIARYLEEPGRFYRETPFFATLFFKKRNGFDEYLGSSRIKRVHRLAEKSARRIIDRMFDKIKDHANTMADDRARSLGIPREQLYTSQEEMIEEFLKSEKSLLEDLREKRQVSFTDEMIINDVAGMKIILEDSDQHKLLELLHHMDNCEVIEEEKHTGNYNATNLILRLSPPREQMLAIPLNDKIIRRMQMRGLSPDAAHEAFVDFVQSGEDTVHLEIIVSNYQDMLESEIGSCMHEDRIIEQRLRQQYRGHLAKNIEYLMEYLFIFPISHQIELNDLPVKLWNRYLPDYFEHVVRKLFQIPQDMYGS